MTQPNIFPHARGSHFSWKAAQQIDLHHRATVTAAYLDLLYRLGPLSDEQAFLKLLKRFRLARSSMSSIRSQCMTTLLVTRAKPVATSQFQREVGTYRLTRSGRAAVRARQKKAA